MNVRSKIGEWYLTIVCRVLHRRLGSRLVDRFIYGPGLFPQSVTREAVRAGCRMQLDLHEQVSRMIYFLGTHEPNETALVERILQPDWVVIDIGAQIGFYTLLIAHKLDPSMGRVYSVEANPRTYQRLRYHVMTNELHHVTVMNRAIGEESGTVDLYPGPDHNTGLSSVHERKRGIVPVTVSQITLDELVHKYGLRRCDLIKIDVEGAEGGVLRGGRRTLERFKPRLLIELNKPMLERSGTSPATLAVSLSDLGYKFYDVANGRCEIGMDAIAATEFMNVYAECPA